MKNPLSRRQLLKLAGYSGLAATLPFADFLKQDKTILKRRILSSAAEMLPLVGLCTRIQLDVGSSETERQPLLDVLKRMVENGGKVIDSEPMYGNSNEVV